MNVDKIFKLMEERNVSWKKLSEATGISNGTIGSWKSGKSRPKLLTLIKISEYFNVPKTYFEDDNLPEGAFPYEPNGFNPVPVWGTVYAGFEGLAYEEYLGVEMTDVKNPENHFWLRVKGDSMYPVINENDLILVRKQPCADSGQIIVATFDGEKGTVKKLRKGSDYIELIPLNPNHDIRIIKGEDFEEFIIHGVVVERKTKF